MIQENLHEVEKIIEKCKTGCSRIQQNDVKLVAVTKNHDIYAMREAIDAGVTAIGENRIQEAIEKNATLERNVEWHLIGHLQTNKVKQAVKIFDLIHSVDSEKLAVELDKAAEKIHKVQDVLVQVNLAREESKFGIYRENLPDLLAKIDNLGNLRLCGFMCIAPNYEKVEDCRPLFHEMYEIFQEAKEIAFKTANIKYLSMGMTHDYRIAIEEGANIVRVGTAIFGQRQY
jgi:PLP dependent protein